MTHAWRRSRRFCRLSLSRRIGDSSRSGSNKKPDRNCAEEAPEDAMFSRVSLAVILAAVAVASPLGPAAGQGYPNRPITLVIPFAPGGSTSIVGRTIADKMSEILG